jgi:hypothetical protein
MDIRINDQWAITSDSNQFVLNRVKIADSDRTDKYGNTILRAGDEYYQSAGYYFSLKSVLEALPEKALKESGINGTLLDVLAFLKEYSGMVRSKLSI